MSKIRLMFVPLLLVVCSLACTVASPAATPAPPTPTALPLPASATPTVMLPTAPAPNPTPTELAPTDPAPTAPAPTDPAPTVTPEIFIHAPVEAVVGDKARTDLAARLGLEVTSIGVVEFTLQDWPDGCLGLPPEGAQSCEKRAYAGLRLVLNAAGHTYEYRATGDGSQIAYGGPVVYGAPPECTQPGTSTVFSPEDGYCFVYPVRFHRTDDHFGPLAIYGPAYGAGPEPLLSVLGVVIAPLGEGQTLGTTTEAFLAMFPDEPAPSRQDLTVAGEPAVLLEPVPGRLPMRVVSFVHNRRIFHLEFQPAPAAGDQTAADVEDLYQTVLGSFHWLP
jgi:hypothetical protein